MLEIPKVGPVAFKVPAISGTALGAGGLSPNTIFRWPNRCLVTGVLLFAREHTDAAMAGLELQIQDETYQAMMTTGIAPTFAPAFAMHGRCHSWYALRRFVEAGEAWVIAVQNTTAGTLTPQLLFRFQYEGGRP